MPQDSQPPKLAEIIADGRSLYTRVARKRNVSESFVSRVAHGMRRSQKIETALREETEVLKRKNAVIGGELVCLDSEGRSIFNVLLHRRGFPTFYAFDLLYLNGRDLRQLPLMVRKRRLRHLIGSSGLTDVICGQYIEGRGVDLFNEVCARNLEGVVARRKTGMYATISGWLKIKNPNYTQSERRHELFESFKPRRARLPAIPKKPPMRAIILSRPKRRTRRRPVR
jgi:ATP-dependent DNA ligase